MGDAQFVSLNVSLSTSPAVKPRPRIPLAWGDDLEAEAGGARAHESCHALPADLLQLGFVIWPSFGHDADGALQAPKDNCGPRGCADAIGFSSEGMRTAVGSFNQAHNSTLARPSRRDTNSSMKAVTSQGTIVGKTSRAARMA